jgi:hypothetical protein
MARARLDRADDQDHRRRRLCDQSHVLRQIEAIVQHAHDGKQAHARGEIAVAVAHRRHEQRAHQQSGCHCQPAGQRNVAQVLLASAGPVDQADHGRERAQCHDRGHGDHERHDEDQEQFLRPEHER